MSKQWDMRDLDWYGVDGVLPGDTVRNENGFVGKVTEKYDNVVWIEPAEKPADKPVKYNFNYVGYMLLAFVNWILSLLWWYDDDLQQATLTMTFAIYFLVMALHCKDDKNNA